MIYLDTNVLVRLITGDNPAQAEQAMQTIEQAAANTFLVTDAILVELCFVLEYHAYAMARQDIADAITALLSAPQITATPDTMATLSLYRAHPKLDYADCLLYVLGGKQGVFTFDTVLQRTLLPDTKAL